MAKNLENEEKIKVCENCPQKLKKDKKDTTTKKIEKMFPHKKKSQETRQCACLCLTLTLLCTKFLLVFAEH